MKAKKMTDAELRQQLERVQQHQHSGRNAEAIALIDDLIETQGEYPRLIHFKGLNLLALNRREEGLSLLEQALALVPDDGVQLTDFGTVLLQQPEEHDRGLEMLERAVEVQPDYAPAQANLGAAFLIAGETERAQTHLEKAVALDPNLVDPLTNLAQLLADKAQYKRAVAILFRALAIAPNLSSAHGRLAGALIQLGRYDAAEYHARRVLELDAGSPAARFQLARVCTFTGRLDEATEILHGLLDDRVAGNAALAQLIHLRKMQPGCDEMRLLDAALADLEALPADQRIALQFAAAKANDDLGHWDTAFDHAQKGNAATAKDNADTPHNLDNYLARGARIREMCDAPFLNGLSGSGLRGTGVVFVCGMPRSGTTLTEQMLTRHPALVAGGEISALPRAIAGHMRLREAVEERIDPTELTADDMSYLGERYLAEVRKQDVLAKRFTDKLPINYNFAPFAALALPDARIVILRRHPLDCILSNYFQNFGKNQPFSTSLDALARVYDNFARSSDQWQALLPGQIIGLSYEDVLAEPERELHRVLAACGLDWDPGVLDHTTARNAVNTASVAQVREPIYQHARARWRPYARHFHPVLRHLRPHLSTEDIEIVETAAADIA